MKLSVIVNTCSLAPHAMEVTGSTTPTPHAVRAYALRHFILPHYLKHADEVIVVGEYEEGEGYTYVSSPSEYRSAVDALAQRQAGFEHASHDLLLFAHDDHLVDLSCFENVPWWTADVFACERKRVGEGTIPNGFRDGYVSGHGAFYRRSVLELAPWGDVPKVHTWDIEHTKMLLAAEARIEETKIVTAWDVEYAT